MIISFLLHCLMSPYPLSPISFISSRFLHYLTSPSLSRISFYNISNLSVFLFLRFSLLLYSHDIATFFIISSILLRCLVSPSVSSLFHCLKYPSLSQVFVFIILSLSSSQVSFIVSNPFFLLSQVFFTNIRRQIQC